jgi:hypothetical protein
MHSSVCALEPNVCVLYPRPSRCSQNVLLAQFSMELLHLTHKNIKHKKKKKNQTNDNAKELTCVS